MNDKKYKEMHGLNGLPEVTQLVGAMPKPEQQSSGTHEKTRLCISMEAHSSS